MNAIRATVAVPVAVLTTVILAAAAGPAAAQVKKAELWFYAYCDKTTEWSEDELYLQMSVDGGKPRRLPGEGHWNVNDNGPKRKVVKKVFERELRPGEEVKIVLIVMEQDDNLLPGLIDVLAKAGEAYAKDKDSKAAPLIPLLAAVIRPFAQNTDDVIGSFAIRMKNVGGKIETTVEPTDPETSVEKTVHDEYPIPNFRCRRDGSNYHVAFWQGGPRKNEPEVGELGK